jgi:outer membrane protein assembly factor BamB
MSIAQPNEPTSRKPLRLWPGIVAAVLLVLVRFVVPLVVSESMPFAMIGAVVAALVILVWWVFFSRAAWSERLGVIVLMIVVVFATSRLIHASIAGGAMGVLFYVWAIPTLAVALVAGAAATRHLADGPRRASIAAIILLACGAWTLVRTEGVTSDLIGSEFHWRWTPTPEQRLLAQAADEPKPLPPPPAATEAPKEQPVTEASNKPSASPSASVTATESSKTPSAAKAADAPATVPAIPAAPKPAAPKREAEWPGFRGPNRDAVVRGVRIKTDWTSSPPVQLWRRPIGPGWSSFAVSGDLLYTQEQRGDDEVVACYRVSTGEPVWRHGDKVRFWESNGGAGPRATPTLSDGRVYTFGATGVLNALDARTGAVIWSRNVATDADRKVPVWGFSSSPLVVDDVVIVAASGTLAGYDLASGKLRWVGPRDLGSYSSPHRATIDGVTQVLLLSGSGAASVAPATGAVLWKHEWQIEGATIVQPALTPDGGILVNSIVMTGGAGIRRLAVARGAGGWTVEERWTSTGLKPYFNDFVVHKGHAFGFDGTILSCIDLSDGARKWKGGRYGNGQLVLLPDEDLLLVLSEEGELALVKATPDQFTELARFKAIEGKTWNHPVLVGDVLLVRNGEEMAAFRLSLEGS